MKHPHLYVDPALATPLHSPEEKGRRIARNRETVREDLAEQRFTFGSRPDVVDLQLSNFCNMSCTMCYDGQNPPLQVMPKDIIEKTRKQILPDASGIVPFAGSEPLTLTWDLTRYLAIESGLELEITTNVQFLDEKRFKELEPHVTRISFSVDTHMRDVFAAIRLRSNPEKVFRNLELAARLCREHGVESRVNIVFMVENAPFLDQTIAYMADLGIDSIFLLRYIHLLNQRKHSDPSLHLSREWIDWMLEKCRKVAEEKKIRLVSTVDGYDVHDYREEPAGKRLSRFEDPLLQKMELYLPGYCHQAATRVKVETDGRLYPCCVGTNGLLEMGSLRTQSFEEIWNGKAWQDLRRGMLCHDVPLACRDCNFHTNRARPQTSMQLQDRIVELNGALVPTGDFDLEEPAHMIRATEPPELSWSPAPYRTQEYHVFLSKGGEGTPHVSFQVPGEETRVRLPEDIWARLTPNFGYWWTVYAKPAKKRQPAVRAGTFRCFVRHQALERIRKSGLQY